MNWLLILLISLLSSACLAGDHKLADSIEANAIQLRELYEAYEHNDIRLEMKEHESLSEDLRLAVRQQRLLLRAQRNSKATLILKEAAVLNDNAMAYLHISSDARSSQVFKSAPSSKEASYEVTKSFHNIAEKVRSK